MYVELKVNINRRLATQPICKKIGYHRSSENEKLGEESMLRDGTKAKRGARKNRKL